MVSPPRVSLYLPVSSLPITAAGKSTVGSLCFLGVAARFASSRLAETTLLEESLLSSGERERRTTVFAGQFFVLGHLLTPLVKM